MVIQCPECQTRFKLADDKLKPGGIKVRCSKCRHVFTVLPTEEEIDFGAFNMEPVAEERGETGPGVTAEPPRAAQAPDEGEMNISFEEEEPAAAAGAPSEFSFEDEEEPDSEDFAFGEEKTESLPSEPAFAKEEETGAEAFAFEDEEPAGISDDFAFEEDEEGADEFAFDEEPFPDTGTEESWGEESAAGPPEDFDFGEGAETAAEAGDFDLSGMDFGGTEPQPPAAADEEFGSFTLDSKPGGEEPVAEIPKPAPPLEAKAPKPPAAAGRRRKTPFRGLMTFLLLLLLALSGVAGYFFWQRGDVDLTQLIEQLTGQATPAPTSGQIRLADLASSFATNREAGQLFVIRGRAVNDYPETRSAIAVKGIVYNPEGKPLLQQTVFCGNPLDETALRDLSFAKIEEHMNNQFGDSLSNLNISPGKTIPFTIVFRNLPPDLAEFTVEVADSKPGSKQ